MLDANQLTAALRNFGGHRVICATQKLSGCTCGWALVYGELGEETDDKSVEREARLAAANEFDVPFWQVAVRLLG